MKKLASLVLASAMAVVPFAAGLAATFTPGEYEATAQGFAGAVTVKVTVDEEKVTAVTVTGENETPALGGAAIEGYNASLIGVADADAVDATAGATVTSNAVKEALAKALAEFLFDDEDALIRVMPEKFFMNMALGVGISSVLRCLLACAILYMIRLVLKGRRTEDELRG